MKLLKSILLILILLLSSSLAFGQKGSIKGRVLDSLSSDPIPLAHAWVEIGGNKIGSSTDNEGYFTIKPLDPGVYDLHISHMAYGDLTVSRISVTGDRITYVQDCKLIEGKTLITVVIHPDTILDRERIDVITGKEIDELPDPRSIVKILAAITPGMMVSHNERDFSFRGARVGDALVVVDGMPVRGTEPNLPGSVISSVSVFSGGVPAKYGDTTGGVIVIETMSYFEWEAQQKRMENMRNRDAAH